MNILGMVHEVNVKGSHLNLLQFKHLTLIINLLITKTMDKPMYSVIYVQKGYVVSDLTDIWS